MRKIFSMGVAGLLALGGAGCQMLGGNEPHATVGYHFGVYKQSVVVGAPPVSTSVVNAVHSGEMGIDQSPALADTQILLGSGRVRGYRQRNVAAAVAVPDPCATDALCARMDRIEILLKNCLPPQPPQAGAQRMPQAPQE